MQKYKNFLKKEVNLNTTDGDQSFHYKTQPYTKEVKGTLAVYINDTMASGNSAFLQLTEKIAETFESKPRQYPTFVFAGITINGKGSGYFLYKTQYAK